MERRERPSWRMLEGGTRPSPLSLCPAHPLHCRRLEVETQNQVLDARGKKGDGAGSHGDDGGPSWGLAGARDLSLSEALVISGERGYASRSIRLFEALLALESLHQLSLRADYVRLVFKLFDAEQEEDQAERVRVYLTLPPLPY